MNDVLYKRMWMLMKKNYLSTAKKDIETETTYEEEKEITNAMNVIMDMTRIEVDVYFANN